MRDKAGGEAMIAGAGLAGEGDEGSRDLSTNLSCFEGSNSKKVCRKDGPVCDPHQEKG